MAQHLISHAAPGRRPTRQSRLARAAVLLTSISLVGAACSPASFASSSSAGATSATTGALRTINHAALQAAFAKGVEETKAPGGIAIVSTPQGRFTVRYGTGKVGTDTPIQPTDHFRIGSTTKTMVGAVILQLAQEGALRLGDPVSKYRPDVPNGDHITIEQLLNMRSGLASYTNTPELGAAVDQDPTRAWKPQELLDLAFRNPPHNAPDAGFYYSNTNTVLLGLIAEQLDGKPLDRVLHDRLFGPLGMDDTFLPKSTSSTIPAPHTQGYLYGTNAILLRIDPTLPPEMQAQLDAGTLPLNDVTDENPSWGWAAGAGISTAEDMVTWIDALVGGKVLDRKYQKLWLDDGQPTDPTQPDGIHYGLAHYSIATPDGSTLYGHSGEIPGYNTWMLRDPKNKVTIVGWANLAPSHGDEAYVSQLIGQIYRPRRAVELTPVTQAVASPPRWYDGNDGRVHLQYELMLTNTVPLPVDISSVQVLGDGRVVESLSGDRLVAAMAPLGSEVGTGTVLPAATVGVVWVDLEFPSRRAIPERVSHRLTVDVGEGLPVGPVIVSTGGRAAVTRHQPTAIGPPLSGGRWVAIGGTAGPHRRALQAVDGHLRLSQRFALDFSALVDRDGRTHAGDPGQSSSYFDYGQAVLAVGAGTIVEAVDRYPDQIPNNHVSLPTAEQDGNHVILELADGIYAGYAHLEPGSVRVRAGDRVSAGQILGRLGNSGASTGPHLHFQLMDRPSIIAADGLPFVFSKFRFDGAIPSLEAFLDADKTGAPVPIDPAGSGPRRRQGEAGLGVLTFPSAGARTTTTRAQHDIEGSIDVGGGRRMFAECRGVGSPTVVLIAGKGNGAEDWHQVLDPEDPEHDAPGDNLPWGRGVLHRSDDAVFPSVARFTRVCTYDRPDVRVDGADVTTPRAQPHTVDLDVSDLHALLAALGEPGPYVLVAHSYGGLIAELFARTYPKTVRGLVMVDTVSELMEGVVGPGKLADWDATNSATSPQVREGVKLIDAFARINAAAPMPKVPAVVLSADKPWRTDLLPPEATRGEKVTFADWLTSLDRLTAALGAEHVTKTNSGHDIYLYSPKVVVDAIRQIVDDVRSGGRR